MKNQKKLLSIGFTQRLISRISNAFGKSRMIGLPKKIITFPEHVEGNIQQGHFDRLNDRKKMIDQPKIIFGK
jgi:hypothetical protein